MPIFCASEIAEIIAEARREQAAARPAEEEGRIIRLPGGVELGACQAHRTWFSLGLTGGGQRLGNS